MPALGDSRTYMQVAIITPEEGPWGYAYIKISPPSPGKAGHTTEIYVPYSFCLNSGVGSFTSHKNHISESGVKQHLRFFVLIREG